MSARASRLIVGNLDAEIELGGSSKPKTAVLEMISAAAASLSVFADSGDRLWTPTPVDCERLPRAAATLLSGPLDRLLDQHEPEADVLAWGETPRVASLRSRPPSLRPPAAAPVSSWRELLWRDHPSVHAARHCNDRRFGHRVATELGQAPAGAQIIETLAELDALLATRSPGPWVVKAPLSASGRDRVRQRGSEFARGVRARIGRLLERGPLLFEPWLERILDLGVVGVVSKDDHLVLPPHRLDVDQGGVFRGIQLDDEGTLGLTEAERESLVAVAARVAQELRAADYVGPFGVDAFVYRDARGQRELIGLCEINARLTFGHVARAHAEDLGLEGKAGFGLGTTPAPADAQLIVSPAPPDGLAVWMAPASTSAAA